MKKVLMNDQEFAKLPADTQEQARSLLKVFDEVHITYEYGKYNVSSGIGIYATYAPDHCFLGTVRATDIFTEDERTQNYLESFHDFPPWYKGKRDYFALRAKYGTPPKFD